MTGSRFYQLLNPKTDHFRFLASRGVDADAVRRAIYGSAVYQSVMRTSIRNPESTPRKLLIVPDISAARYLEEAFPGSHVEKLESGLIDLNGTANNVVVQGNTALHRNDNERIGKRIKESEQQTSSSTKKFSLCCEEQL